MEEELQQYGEELFQEVEGLLDHDYSPVVQAPLYKRPRYEAEPAVVVKHIAAADHVGGTLGHNPDVMMMSGSKHRKYIEPPLDDMWPPPKTDGQPATPKVVDKLEALTNELKINISDTDGTRTVLLKVPREQ